MSVLIKGMEMPKKSGQYVLYLDVYGDPPAAPPAVHMADCVRYFVFEVPEPHGRLGDLDALLKKCEFVCTDDDVDVRAVRYSVIDNAPTIIPASVEVSA